MGPAQLDRSPCAISPADRSITGHRGDHSSRDVDATNAMVVDVPYVNVTTAIDSDSKRVVEAGLRANIVSKRSSATASHRRHQTGWRYFSDAMDAHPFSDVHIAHRI